MRVYIDVKFPGARKVRKCIVYPLKVGDTFALIQSDDAIARVNLTDGTGTFAVNAGGAYFHHLMVAAKPFNIDPAALDTLRDIPHGDGTVLLGGAR
jgi:hypothetical protein